MMIVLWLICFVLVLLLVKSWINMIDHRRGYNLKGPFPLPVVGNGLLFIVKSSEVLWLLQKLSKRFGDAFLVYFLNNPYVMLSHPRYIEPIVMSSELLTKGRAYSYFKPWLGDGLLTTGAKYWKVQRKFLTPAFHFNILQDFLPVFNKNGRILIDKLDGLADGKSINIFPILALNTLDNITEAIIGQCVNAQTGANSEYVESITTLTHILSLRALVPILSNDFIFNRTIHKKKHDAAISLMHKYIKDVLGERRKEHKKMNIDSLQGSKDLGIKNKHTFLDLLLLADVDGDKLDENSILAEVQTFVFAGQDTTTSGMVFSLYCISKHSDIQEKVFQEQERIFEDNLNRDPTHTDLNKMKYLELVIKESMRIYPPVPLIERGITEDVEVGGLKLRKGTTVSLNLFQMHRHPDVYQDPLEFRPERFEAGSVDAKKPYYVFSAGPRNCIGNKFAMLELKATLSKIIKRFEILPVKSEPLVCADVVLRSDNGVHVRLQRR